MKITKIFSPAARTIPQKRFRVCIVIANCFICPAGPKILAFSEAPQAKKFDRAEGAFSKLRGPKIELNGKIDFETVQMSQRVLVPSFTIRNLIRTMQVLNVYIPSCPPKNGSPPLALKCITLCIGPQNTLKTRFCTKCHSGNRSHDPKPLIVESRNMC